MVWVLLYPQLYYAVKTNKNFLQTIGSLRLSKQKKIPYFELTAGNELWFPDVCELASKQEEKRPCKSKMHIKKTRP